jgi:hypothetical protein
MQNTLFEGCSTKPRDKTKAAARTRSLAYYYANHEKRRAAARERARVLRQQDREGANAKRRAWAKSNPKRRAAHYRRSVHGLSPADFDAMMQRQQGGCAICHLPFGKAHRDQSCIDHDHATGRVRGLLCHACNKGIGLLGDDEQRLTAAARYLAEHADKAAANAA